MQQISVIVVASSDCCIQRGHGQIQAILSEPFGVGVLGWQAGGWIRCASGESLCRRSSAASKAACLVVNSFTGRKSMCTHMQLVGSHKVLKGCGQVLGSSHALHGNLIVQT